MRGELVGHLRRTTCCGNHVAATDVDLVSQGQGDRLPFTGGAQFIIAADDARNL